jgi:hypothetical protein
MRRRQSLLVIILLLLAITSGACVAKNVVVRVDPNTKLNKKDGVFYQLPRTVVALALPVKKVAQKPGLYERFAACFFPDDEQAKRIVHKKCDSFELGDPSINTRGEPDSSETFMLKMRGHYFEDKKLTLALSEGGVPSKITEETTNHAVEILTQTAQTVTSLILQNAKAAFLASEDETNLEEVIRGLDRSVVCAAIKQELTNLRDALKALNEAKSARDQARIELAQAKAKVGVKPAEIEVAEKNAADKQKDVDTKAAAFDALDPNGDVLDAVRLFKRILALQQQRNQLAISPAENISGDVLRIALDEYDKLIAALKIKFLGTKSTEKIWIASFELTPTDGGFGTGRDFRLFSLSPSAGVCGTPLDPLVRFVSLNVPGDFKCKSTIPPDCDGEIPRTQIVAVALSRDSNQLYTRIRDSFSPSSESGERGFFYRIPAVVTATVKLDDEKLFQTELKVAQLGLTTSLPASTGGRRTNFELDFYETGAMKNFVLGSDALIQASTVKDLGEAAGNVIATKKEAEKQAKAAKDAAAIANDEAAKAKALSDLLETCKKIKDAQVALGKEVILPAVCNQ